MSELTLSQKCDIANHLGFKLMKLRDNGFMIMHPQFKFFQIESTSLGVLDASVKHAEDCGLLNFVKRENQ